MGTVEVVSKIAANSPPCSTHSLAELPALCDAFRVGDGLFNEMMIVKPRAPPPNRIGFWTVLTCVVSS